MRGGVEPRPISLEPSSPGSMNLRPILHASPANLALLIQAACFAARLPAMSGAVLEILVGHWAILDGKVQPGRRRTIGRPVRLVVEPLEDHAQLDSERQVMEIEHVELPQYVDVE